jgi:hypothetical protein
MPTRSSGSYFSPTIAPSRFVFDQLRGFRKREKSLMLRRAYSTAALTGSET